MVTASVIVPKGVFFLGETAGGFSDDVADWRHVSGDGEGDFEFHGDSVVDFLRNVKYKFPGFGVDF